ncbi:hypothetical protein SAMN04490209_3337 [Pseudomonas rhodesiae]|uniref:Uncharacterized protein n=1 Tax=Pseudomonas rhodesiae TaxID=76760 RepID=A0AAE8HDY9_9PSED|nr:hypothetical protein SAMN04490209_3337 [Pseudomonas rhodesiae]
MVIVASPLPHLTVFTFSVCEGACPRLALKVNKTLGFSLEKYHHPTSEPLSSPSSLSSVNLLCSMPIKGIGAWRRL